MRNQLGNLTIRNLIICYILLYSIMPIVARLTSIILTTYFYMAIVVMLVVLILVLDRPENLNLYGSFLLPFVLYGLFTFFTTKQTFIMWGYQTLLFWLPVILGYYFTQDLSRILGSYTKIILLALVVTMITTIVGCIQNPNAARTLATVSSSEDSSYEYDMMNIGGYNFVYYMILLYPVIILAYKSHKIKIIPTVTITVIILLTVVYSEYTTALLLFILSSALFFFRRNLSLRGIVIISIFSVLLLFVFTSVIVDFLHWLRNAIGSEVIATRLDALAGGTIGLEQSEDKRLELYLTSIERFMNHPLFGTSIYSIISDGGHSFILDSLARYGILGGAILFFMYKKIYMRFFIPFKDKPGFGYVVWTFIQAIILSLVNTGMFLEVLCLFCPILFYWIYGTESDIETKTEEIENEDTVDSKHASGLAG